MEFNNQEVAALEEVSQASKLELLDLELLQLSLIGGGVGEVIIG